MRRTAVLAGLGALAVVACASSLALADAQPTFQTSSTYLSKYIWRGFTNSTESVVRSNVSIGLDDFSLNVWSNYDPHTTNNVNEVEYTLDYTKRHGPCNYSLGYTYYTFPNTGAARTQELYFGVTNWKSEWSPSLKVYYDFDEGKGTYAALSVSHNLTKSRLPASFSASLGYNSNFFWTKTGFSDLVLSLRVPVKINRNLALVPTFSYSKGLHSDFEDTFYTGLSLAWGR